MLTKKVVSIRIKRLRRYMRISILGLALSPLGAALLLVLNAVR